MSSRSIKRGVIALFAAAVMAFAAFAALAVFKASAYSDNFTAKNDAEIRLQGTGIRFTFNVKDGYAEELTNAGGDYEGYTASLGAAILPATFLDGEELLANGKYIVSGKEQTPLIIDLVNKGKTESGYTSYNAVVTGIPVGSYEQDLSARGFIKLVKDGAEDAYVYTEVTATRSIGYVATEAYKNAEGEEKSALERLLNASVGKNTLSFDKEEYAVTPQNNATYKVYGNKYGYEITAAASVKNENVARVEGNQIVGVSDGETEITVTVGEKTATAKVTVTGFTVTAGLLGEIGKANTENVLSISSLEGDIESLTVGEFNVEFAKTTNGILVNGNAFEGLSGEITVTVRTSKKTYAASVMVVDLIVNTAFDYNTFIGWGQENSHDDASIIFNVNIDNDGDLLNRLWHATGFNGTIDGRGYTIKNIETKAGIFHALGASAVIKNIGLIIDVIGADAGGNISYVASGVSANCQGNFYDCYIDINFEDAVGAAATTMIGGFFTNRDLFDGYTNPETNSSYLVIDNCIVKATASSTLLASANLHSLKGAIMSLPDEGSCRDNIGNVIVLGNFEKAIGRLDYMYTGEGLLPQYKVLPVYSDENAAVANGEVSFAGEYWANSAGKLPILINSSAEYVKFETEKIDALGFIDGSENLEVSTTALTGEVTSVSIGGKSVEFTAVGDKITIAKENLPVSAGEKVVIITTNSKIYESKIIVATLVVDSIEDFETMISWGEADEHSDAYIVFGANIDYGNYLVERLWNAGFNGIIDGQGYGIYNVSTKAGIFGLVNSEAIIRNLGFVNITVVDVAESKEFGEAFMIASGIVAQTKGTWSDCYFDVVIDIDIQNYAYSLNAMVAGFTTNRDIQSYGAVKVTNSVFKVTFTQEVIDAPTTIIHPLSGAVVACGDTEVGNTAGIYVVSVKPTFGRTYGVQIDNYPDEESLLTAETEFASLTGDFWTKREGSMPKLVNMY